MGRTFLFSLLINLPGRYLDISGDLDGDLISESIDAAAEVLVTVWHGPGLEVVCLPSCLVPLGITCWNLAVVGGIASTLVLLG